MFDFGFRSHTRFDVLFGGYESAEEHALNRPGQVYPISEIVERIYSEHSRMFLKDLGDGLVCFLRILVTASYAS